MKVCQGRDISSLYGNHCNVGDPLYMSFAQGNSILNIKLVNPTRTGVFGERVSLGRGVFHPSRVYSFVCTSRVLKLGAQLKMGKTYHRKQY